MRPDAGQRDEVVARLLERHARQPVERQLQAGIARLRGDRAQDRLDARRLDLRDPARADRLLDLGHGASRTASHVGKALAQAQVGDVAVAVVGRLREDRQDQLGDRMAVRAASAARRTRRAGGRGSLVTRARVGGFQAVVATRADARAGAGGRNVSHRITVSVGEWPVYPRPVPEVSDHTGEIDGLPVFWRSAAGPKPPRRQRCPLYLHGVPTNSDEWLPFLARTGGLAPDLPGFGRSGKPGSLRYTIDEYDRFIERFLDLRSRAREPRRARLGRRRAGLRAAPPRAHRAAGRDQRRAVPARLSLAPHGAHLAHAGARRAGDGRHHPPVLRLLSREANATPGPMPEAWLDSVLDHFDQGTQRAILRLYRSAPPAVLEAAGGATRAAADARARDVGHEGPLHPRALRPGVRERARRSGADSSCPTRATGPWLDRPDAIDRVVDFLGARGVSRLLAGPGHGVSRAARARLPAWTITALGLG